MDNKAWFSTAEAAKLIGVSRVTVFRWIKTGKIQADKVGKAYVILRSELSEYVKSDQVPDEKELIKHQVDLVVKRYGKTLKMLGAE
ncbi:helix-turn-helix domain-containing protein [Patescibacteria group bacterium]|nr:helix-turn-helix domain-containing protein [Patescibacteria group bacterium]